VVEPLCIIDQANHGLITGVFREQGQHRQPDQESVRRLSSADPERCLEGLRLRRRQPLKTVEKGVAQLMNPGERKLHLRLDAGRAEDPAVGRGVDEVVQQRRLADPGLTLHNEHGTAS
jgi:hypothetical protein